MINFEVLGKLLFYSDLAKLPSLTRKKYIKPINPDGSLTQLENYDLTKLGTLIVENEKVSIQEIDITPFAQEYRKLFKDVNPARTGDLQTVKVKLSRFMEQYDSSQEEILAAVNLYISELSDSNFIKGADNFIFFKHKDSSIEQSALLNYITRIRNGESPDWFKQTV